MTEAELIEILQNGDQERIGAVLNVINGVGQSDPRFLKAAAERFDDRQGGEYADLQDDERIWKAVQQCDKELAARFPDASYEQRLDTVAQIARMKFGSAESRVIAEMQARRRNLPPPDPFAREVEVEERTEFDSEHDAGISEAIAHLRKARAGTPLSAIRGRAPAGAGAAEADE